MKVLPIMLSLAFTVISCRSPQWKTETYTYDNVVREPLSIETPVPIFYQKYDVKFRYKIIGRAHAISSKKQNYQDPMPLSLLQNQARNIGGDALLAPELNDSFTWTAPIIKGLTKNFLTTLKEFATKSCPKNPLTFAKVY